MSLAILALLGWFVLIVFAFTPKGLTLTDIIFLYCLIGIITVTVFTILDVNLQWVPVTRSVEGSFAMYICRFIVIPFSILLSVCVLNSNLTMKWRWGFSAAIVLFLCMADRIYLWANLISFIKWNAFYSAIMYGAFMVLVWWIARWFLALDKGDSRKT